MGYCLVVSPPSGAQFCIGSVDPELTLRAISCRRSAAALKTWVMTSPATPATTQIRRFPETSLLQGVARKGDAKTLNSRSQIDRCKSLHARAAKTSRAVTYLCRGTLGRSAVRR